MPFANGKGIDGVSTHHLSNSTIASSAKDIPVPQAVMGSRRALTPPSGSISHSVPGSKRSIIDVDGDYEESYQGDTKKFRQSSETPQQVPIRKSDSTSKAPERFGYEHSEEPSEDPLRPCNTTRGAEQGILGKSRDGSSTTAHQMICQSRTRTPNGHRDEGMSYEHISQTSGASAASTRTASLVFDKQEHHGSREKTLSGQDPKSQYDHPRKDEFETLARQLFALTEYKGTYLENVHTSVESAVHAVTSGMGSSPPRVDTEFLHGIILGMSLPDSIRGYSERTAAFDKLHVRLLQYVLAISCPKRQVEPDLGFGEAEAFIFVARGAKQATRGFDNEQEESGGSRYSKDCLENSPQDISDQIGKLLSCMRKEIQATDSRMIQLRSDLKSSQTASEKANAELETKDADIEDLNALLDKIRSLLVEREQDIKAKDEEHKVVVQELLVRARHAESHGLRSHEITEKTRIENDSLREQATRLRYALEAVKRSAEYTEKAPCLSCRCSPENKSLATREQLATNNTKIMTESTEDLVMNSSLAQHPAEDPFSTRDEWQTVPSQKFITEGAGTSAEKCPANEGSLNTPVVGEEGSAHTGAEAHRAEADDLRTRRQKDGQGCGGDNAMGRNPSDLS